MYDEQLQLPCDKQTSEYIESIKQTINVFDINCYIYIYAHIRV